MIKKGFLFLLLSVFISCSIQEDQGLNEETMASMGSKIKHSFEAGLNTYESRLAVDSTDVEAWVGLADTHITLYIFGFSSRVETIPEAKSAYRRARQLDPAGSKVRMLEGMLHLLDWKWEKAEKALLRSIQADPGNLKARHWYSLYLSAMGYFDEAMAQSDTIVTMDPEGHYMIGRGSLLYFARENEALKDLMIEAVAKDTSVAWGYDWLGMAYIELKEYKNSIDTYYKAFELSDGTVEVGGGLGHALGLAGEYETAKRMADFYAMMSEDHYLPPVQRSFIHIGIGEYDEAIGLLEQACEENSWFLVFMKIEPWYDPIRGDERFQGIMDRMNFPDFK